MVYLISYDLRNPGQKYEQLHKQIKDLGAWAHILESTWLVDTQIASADEVFKRLKPPLDENDYAFVIQLNSKNHQGWLSEELWKWIHERL